MSNGETVTVRLGGQDFQLPTTLAVLRQLGHAQICPMYLSQLAAIARQPLVLNLAQALDILVIGFRAAGVGATTADAIWQEARRRKLGAPDVCEAALDYVSAFVSAMPAVEAPPAPEGTGDPKP